MDSVTKQLDLNQDLQPSKEPSFHSGFRDQIHLAQPQISSFDEVNDDQPNMIFDKASMLSSGKLDLLGSSKLN